jgi:uncharacterized protein HemY
LAEPSPIRPSLNFALGNLYAQQGRWNDAQQAYFRAYAGDGDNPDYPLFNLAVSLEQLRQPKLALQYYQGRSLRPPAPAAFDKRQAARPRQRTAKITGLRPLAPWR